MPLLRFLVAAPVIITIVTDPNTAAAAVVIAGIAAETTRRSSRYTTCSNRGWQRLIDKIEKKGQCELCFYELLTKDSNNNKVHSLIRASEVEQ